MALSCRLQEQYKNFKRGNTKSAGFSQNNSGNTVTNGSQGWKTEGPLKSQFPLYFLIVGNENWANLLLLDFFQLPLTSNIFYSW